MSWSGKRVAGNYEGKSTCLRNQNLQDAVVKAEVRVCCSPVLPHRLVMLGFAAVTMLHTFERSCGLKPVHSGLQGGE